MTDARVIIHQCDTCTSRVIQEWLRDRGVNLEDVSFVPSLDRAEQELIADEAQMLIFDSDRGIMHGIPERVQKMRDQNTRLVCVLYTLAEVFDDQIRHFPIEAVVDKVQDINDHKLQGLITVINDFRTGQLCRDDKQNWHHAPEIIKQELKARF